MRILPANKCTKLVSKEPTDKSPAVSLQGSPQEMFSGLQVHSCENIGINIGIFLVKYRANIGHMQKL